MNDESRGEGSCGLYTAVNDLLEWIDEGVMRWTMWMKGEFKIDQPRQLSVANGFPGYFLYHTLNVAPGLVGTDWPWAVGVWCVNMDA